MNKESLLTHFIILLTAKGYTKKYHDKEHTIFTNGSIRVGIFNNNYPHLTWKNHILAEHEENFDKWSKHFYNAPMPNSIAELKLILSDLKHIDDLHNRVIGNKFGTLIRSF